VHSVLIIDWLFGIEVFFVFRNFFIISTPSVVGWITIVAVDTFRRSVFILDALDKVMATGTFYTPWLEVTKFFGVRKTLAISALRNTFYGLPRFN